MRLSLLHNKHMSVKSGVLLPMKSGGVQLYILQKWGGQILKWGGHDSPTFNGGNTPDSDPQDGQKGLSIMLYIKS